MDLKKQLEFFDPNKFEDHEIHIIGVGAIGSHIAEMLTRMGFEDLTLYDFDTVDQHNITNQMYFETQFDVPKLEAITDHCRAINRRIRIRMKPEGWVPGTRLARHVILAVDNIDLRRAIVEENMLNPNILSLSDYRMGLTNAQHYFADWTKEVLRNNLLAGMQFSHEEAKESMPVSACGTSLNVLPTVRMITAVGVANWMNFLKTKTAKKVILIDSFRPSIEAY